MRSAILLLCLSLVPACGDDDDTTGGDGPPADGPGNDGTPNDGPGQDSGACSAPTPVALTAPGGDFMIDSTEVPACAYQAWLATGPDPVGQPAPCGWNDSFAPSTDPGCGEANTNGNAPMVCLDWCDAQAYCAAQGGRLCGQIGGGFMDWTQYADADVSEWDRACSRAGAESYPYGGGYQPSACVGDAFDGNAGFDPGSDVLQPTGTATCNGQGMPWHDLFDLSGNAQEWEDACDLAFGPDDSCLVRGGSFATGETLLACDGPMQYRTRQDASADVGFRCCY